MRDRAATLHWVRCWRVGKKTSWTIIPSYSRFGLGKPRVPLRACFKGRNRGSKLRWLLLEPLFNTTVDWVSVVDFMGDRSNILGLDILTNSNYISRHYCL